MIAFLELVPYKEFSGVLLAGVSLGMAFSAIILVYALSWWVIFYALLPIGVKNEPVDRHGVSAPTRPLMLYKILGATGLAVVTTGIVWSVLALV